MPVKLILAMELAGKNYLTIGERWVRDGDPNL
jgi:hypothetical protein